MDKPKYKKGDKVYIVDGYYAYPWIIEIEVSNYLYYCDRYNFHVYTYNEDACDTCIYPPTINESDMFLSKNELIDAQIAKWEKWRDK